MEDQQEDDTNAILESMTAEPLDEWNDGDLESVLYLSEGKQKFKCATLVAILFGDEQMKGARE